VVNLLNGLLDHFVDEVYASLGDLLDILALINNGVNFFLYCTMSKQFRDTFVHLFGCCRSRRSATSSKSINCETAEECDAAYCYIRSVVRLCPSVGLSTACALKKTDEQIEIPLGSCSRGTGLL